MKMLRLRLSKTFKILFRNMLRLKIFLFFSLLNENGNTRIVFNSSEEYLIFLSYYFRRFMFFIFKFDTSKNLME